MTRLSLRSHARNPQLDTITQQVVRNVFLDKDKNLWRKLKELYLAVRLEQSVSKKKILETNPQRLYKL